MGPGPGSARLRAAALTVLAAGAAGSVAVTVFAGRRNPSRLLVAAFVVWVLSPFAALLWAHAASRRWPALVQAALTWTMPAVALGSLAVYAHRVLSPPRAQAAFVFVVVPPASWVLIALALGVAMLLSRRRHPPGGHATRGR